MTPPLNLGILAAAGGVAETFWITALDSSSGDIPLPQEYQWAGLDSDGNFYISGFAATPNDSGFVIKFDRQGTIVWKKQFALSPSTNTTFQSLAIDSSGIYTGGRTDAKGSFVKYDFNGNIIWQKEASGNFMQSQGAATLPSGDIVYQVSGDDVFGSQDWTMMKLDSNGNYLSGKILGTTVFDLARGLAVDGSSNIYVCNYGLSAIITTKLDSNFNVQWIRAFQNDGGNPQAWRIAVDSSGNSVTGAEGYSPSGAIGTLVKYDASGNRQWVRGLKDGGDTDCYGVALDQDNNVYAIYESAGSNKVYFSKHNTSGVLQWQREMVFPVNCEPMDIVVDELGSLFASIKVGDLVGGANNDTFVAKLPTDGSLVGSYNIDGQTITYQASSLTQPTVAVNTISFSYSANSHSRSLSNGSASNSDFTAVTQYLTSIE